MTLCLVFEVALYSMHASKYEKRGQIINGLKLMIARLMAVLSTPADRKAKSSSRH
jgi:hypothetical protein